MCVRVCERESKCGVNVWACLRACIYKFVVCVSERVCVCLCV